jgi:CheY-like chemotaxis protein
VRSLVGSGATYGYAGVSAAADPLDQALDSPSTFGLKALSALINDLIDACERALVQENVAAGRNILPFRPPPQPGGARATILIVDDDPAIHDLVRAMFKNNARVLSAYDGAEAIKAVQQYCPDIILLDNYMPGDGGLRLLDRLSQERNSASTPVIMLTADDKPNEIMRAASAGIADYVLKPFEPRMLADKINAVLLRMRMTVLVAHGDATMRDMIAGRLRRMGFAVVEAVTGQAAIELAAARMPDLILLDQTMPGMESGGILHNLRTDRHTRHIPILFLAADHEGHSLLENLDAGTVEPVAMPSSPDKVAMRIADALGLERLPS